MTALITAETSLNTTTPALVLGYQTARTSRNIIHDLLSGEVGVALVAPRPRSGTLELLYPVEADAFTALNLHAEETVFTLTDTDRASVAMSYVVDGDITIELDDETRDHWVVSVGYQEVAL